MLFCVLSGSSERRGNFKLIFSKATLSKHFSKIGSLAKLPESEINIS